MVDLLIGCGVIGLVYGVLILFYLLGCWLVAVETREDEKAAKDAGVPKKRVIIIGEVKD
jgi:hypothetical protein